MTNTHTTHPKPDTTTAAIAPSNEQVGDPSPRPGTPT